MKISIVIIFSIIIACSISLFFIEDRSKDNRKNLLFDLENSVPVENEENRGFDLSTAKFVEEESTGEYDLNKLEPVNEQDQVEYDLNSLEPKKPKVTYLDEPASTYRQETDEDYSPLRKMAYQALIAGIAGGFISLLLTLLGVGKNKKELEQKPKNLTVKNSNWFIANTPAKRIGLIFLVLSIIPYFFLAVYWNIAEKLFFEEIDIVSRIPSEKPQDDSETYWLYLDVKHSWIQVNKVCDTAKGTKHFLPDECIVSEQEDKYTVIGKQWDASSWFEFMDFLNEAGVLVWFLIFFWAGLFLRIGTLDFLFFLLKKIFIGIKKSCIWIKTGHWERKPKLTKKNPKLSSCLKKWIYGTIVVSVWISFELTLKYNGIKLGGIPYGLLVFFWLWTFSKATGLDLGFKRKNVENKDT